eukprot:4526179-Amphidinium_carterae.1
MPASDNLAVYCSYWLLARDTLEHSSLHWDGEGSLVQWSRSCALIEEGWHLPAQKGHRNVT